ncbi:MAG TPA: MOSC domain-containing protein [Saprospiraceae bacterium]|nr:MOSC domain-containing protein [Saprospiraceae bacterium]
MFKVESLHVYPVKGLAGTSLLSAIPEPRGFRYDRRWMLVDPLGGFISQREYPSLAKWEASVDDDHLCISHRQDSGIRLEISLDHWDHQPRIPVTIWKDTVLAHTSSTFVNEWLTKNLEFQCQLVHMGGNSHRAIDPAYAVPGEEVSFADGYPYLITTTASLADLSGRMEENLIMRRFRPNIVIGTNHPFAEDQWQRIRIGDHLLRLPKPCARCQVITIDPETTAINPAVLTSLAGFRKEGNKVLFGMNACWESGSGAIRVGDPVHV